MFSLRVGYFIGGFITGLVLLINFLGSLPDGKLHIVFCNVGQGDAAYVRFPDGRDMVIDGGPSDAVLECLGKHMPFWDRSLDIVLLSHPQKDHMQGITAILTRFTVGYFLRSELPVSSEGAKELERVVGERKVNVRFVTAGERVNIGRVLLSVVWPSQEQVTRMNDQVALGDGSVLGTSTVDVNDGSVVFWLRYGDFDALFPGDADSRVEKNYIGYKRADDGVELLKVPHHGSKTGMTKAFADGLRPEISVISVGRNTYGHPTQEALDMLANVGSRVLRTDKEGDIEVVSDGSAWEVRSK